ncbi:MAG: flagellar biosynthetic protein FliR [Planctomycetota bacterium]
METFLYTQTALFTLVLGRVGGIVTTAPLLSTPAAPIRVRAILAVAMSMVVMPLFADTPLPGELELIGFARMVVGEVLVGLLLGLGVTVLLSGVQLAGQMVSQMAGMTLGEISNPELDSSVSVYTQLFYFVTIAVFVTIGGHRMMIEALLQTFEWAPPGQAYLGESFPEAMVTMLSQSAELGVRASAPIVIALFLSTVVLGLISRTLPQINTIVVGFGVNSLLTLGVMMLTLGGVVWTFQEPLAGAIDFLAEAAAHRTPDDFRLAPLAPSP